MHGGMHASGTVGGIEEQLVRCEVVCVQDMAPVVMLGALHFAAITDLAWSSDGRFLAVSSSDAFCR